MTGEPHRPRRGLLKSIRSRARPLGPELERLLRETELRADGVEQAVRDLALGESSPPGFSPEIHLAPGIPRLRPVLVFLAHRAAGGGSTPREDDVASIAELLHLTLRMHDAALGRQGGRRRRVARRLLGGAAHWLGGNHLLLRSLELAQALPSPVILGEVVVTLREIAEGQALAEELRNRDPSATDYREYAEGHAGAVMAFCTRAGGHLAGAPRPVLTALARYGRHIGVAWTAVEDQWLFERPPDDLLSRLAQVTATGRPVLPLIRALAHDPRVDALLDRVLAEGDPAQLEELVARVQAAGGVREAQRFVATECRAARRALARLPDSPHRELLDRIAVALASPAGGPDLVSV